MLTPGREPPSTSAWTTRFRNVSELIPSCSPILRGAQDRIAGSRRASTAHLIARSRSSSGYFLGAAMTLILTCDEGLHQTRCETRGAVPVWLKAGPVPAAVPEAERERPRAASLQLKGRLQRVSEGGLEPPFPVKGTSTSS